TGTPSSSGSTRTSRSSIWASPASVGAGATATSSTTGAGSDGSRDRSPRTRTAPLACRRGRRPPRAGGARRRRSERPMSAQLSIHGVSKSFGGVQAVSGVDLEVGPDELVSGIGPNGAGMTVLDNLMLGRHVRMRSGVLASIAYWGLAQREEVRHRRRVEDVIDFLRIQDLRRRVTGSLPYGLQKRVELGRAVALEPKLLLLDEPMGGMNQEEKEDMARFILDVNEEWGTTVVLIEHDMGVVMDISDRVAVLDMGQKIAEGTPDEVRANPRVIKAYLGEKKVGRPARPVAR